MAGIGCINCEDALICPDAFKDIAVHCGAYDTGTKSDNVNHPKHYETHIKGLEAIDIIYAALGPEKFVGYCRGNALKYLLRADAKNGVEDLEKAAVYLDWEINIRKERNTTNEKAIKLRRL